MTIKNTSSKIISIGKAVLLPDDTVEVSDAVANAPAIKAMAARGQLSIKKGKDAKGKDAKTGVEAETNDAAEETDQGGKEEAGHGDTGESEESGGTEESGGDGTAKKPLSRMNKGELIAECQRLGIEVGPDDTNPTMVDKIKAATAE